MAVFVEEGAGIARGRARTMKKIEHLKDLTHDPKNARRHNPRNVGMLERSLNEVGAARSIVIDESGVVLAGNATIDAAAQAGITKVQVVEADGETVIAVQRRGLTPEQKTKLALYDNRVAELADWDGEVLEALAGEVDLSALFNPDELAAILAVSLPEAGGGGDEFDATPDVEGPTRTALGDLWQIGGVHRLLVGDCTDPANVERLMGGERAGMTFTDTPYNIDYQANESIASLKARNRRTDGLVVLNDSAPDIPISGFRQMVDMTKPGGALYVCFPAEQPLVLGAMWQEPARLQSMIVWLKDRMVMGRKDYHYRHEPLWYGWKEGAAHRWYGGHAQTTVWEIGRPTDSEDHPTEKPIALPQRAIENSSQPNDIVIDFFAGSGTTLTAAHRTGRRAYLCELSPRYADVILRRAEAEGLAVEKTDG